jgi:hypothetical protein
MKAKLEFDLPELKNGQIWYCTRYNALYVVESEWDANVTWFRLSEYTSLASDILNIENLELIGEL